MFVMLVTSLVENHQSVSISEHLQLAEESQCVDIILDN